MTASPRTLPTSLTLTSHEVASLLCALALSRGVGLGSEFFSLPVAKDMVAAAREIGELTQGAHGHMWLPCKVLHAYTETHGLTNTVTRAPYSDSGALKQAAARAVAKVSSATLNGKPATTKGLCVSGSGVHQSALDLAVSLGLLETHRPSRARLDRYRLTAR